MRYVGAISQIMLGMRNADDNSDWTCADNIFVAKPHMTASGFGPNIAIATEKAVLRCLMNFRMIAIN